MIVLSSSGKHLSNNDTVVLKTSSINLPETTHFYIVSDSQLSALTAELHDTSVMQLYAVDNDAVELYEQLTLDVIDEQVLSSKYVYAVHVMTSSEYEGTYDNVLTIVIDNTTTVNLNLTCNIEGYDEQLVVTLNNMKRFITEEYMHAMHATNWQTSDIDTRIYNRKIREYLMNILYIDAMQGSYKGLQTILKWFGYGDLLELREYWISRESNTYKSTAIADAVVTSIDKSLSGYRKTNQLSLVYQINQQDGVDDDALPIYVNVLSHTDEILFKLWHLERILERDFLHQNTHIVDIIGEFQSVVGLELNVVLNDANVLTVNLTEDLNHAIDVSYDTNIFPISAHSVLTWFPFAFVPGDPELTRVEGATSGSHIDEFFDINKILTGAETTQTDYELLTTYYSGDFSLFKFDVDLNEDVYQAFKYALIDVDTEEIVFMSSYKNISAFDGTIKCGVKTPGTYKLLLYMFDWYGSASIISIDDTFESTVPYVDFYLGVYGKGVISRDLKLWTTFRDRENTDALPVVDNISETLDINTWDRTTNTPTMQISKLYASDFDQLEPYASLNSLNSLRLDSLRGMPLHVHGYTVSICVIDLVGDASIGDRTLRIKLFEDKPWTEFTKNYNGSLTPVQWLQTVANALNLRTDEFSNFNWDVHVYSDDPDGYINSGIPVLRGKSNKLSLKSSIYTLDFDAPPAVEFADQVFKHDVHLFTQTDAVLQFCSLGQTVTDTLSVTIGGSTYTMPNLTIETNAQIVKFVKAILQMNNIHDVMITETDYGLIYCSSNNDIVIQHAVLGRVHDITRGIHSSEIIKIRRGSDIRLGEPVFAFIDELTRNELSNIKWTLINTVTGNVVTTQRAYAFRWIITTVGTYSLKLEWSDRTGSHEKTHEGCVIVRDIYDLTDEEISIWSSQ